MESEGVIGWVLVGGVMLGAGAIVVAGLVLTLALERTGAKFSPKRREGWKRADSAPTHVARVHKKKTFLYPEVRT